MRAAIEARRRHPGLAVLVLSQYVEHDYARELLGADATGVGYLLKDRVADVGDFVDAVRRVAAGGTALDPEVVALRVGNRLVVEVHDDGHGGAAVAPANDLAPTGLRGLADRVAGVDGELVVSSPEGGPTVVRAEIPWEP